VTARVMVFVDYQNVVRSALACFHPRDASRTDGHVDPFALGELLVARWLWPSRLVGVRVYRGRPNPNRQPVAASANDAQASRWERNPLVRPVRRDLRYPADYPDSAAQEKGIDVALAVDFVRLAIERAYDVGIVVSRDSDLMPALETVHALDLARVEVAGWPRLSRLRFSTNVGPWCHQLDFADYNQVRDTKDYVKRS
jgi:uncharacterized LabA/DUF88 family protein